MKRSSWLSGSRYVPSWSTGFCVAITMNGGASGWRRAVDRDLALLHRLEQRRLRLRGGPVDLVGQHDVGEQRSRLELEVLGGALVDAHADEVGGQQVGRELDALPRAVDRRGHRLGEAGLADPGHVLDDEVALGEQAHHRELDALLLAVQHLGDVRGDRVEQRREAGVAGSVAGWPGVRGLARALRSRRTG